MSRIDHWSGDLAGAADAAHDFATPSWDRYDPADDSDAEDGEA
jgi:hypothetical protein